MKRTAIIFLTVIYLLSLVGFGIDRFYCCGRLASVALTYAQSDNTGKETGKKNNCCKHEKQSFKVKDSHVNAPDFVFSVLSYAILPVQHNRAAAALPAEQAITTNYQANAPPGKHETPIYILHCTYRI